jgi:hypothetical protein
MNAAVLEQVGSPMSIQDIPIPSVGRPNARSAFAIGWRDGYLMRYSS